MRQVQQTTPDRQLRSPPDRQVLCLLIPGLLFVLTACSTSLPPSQESGRHLSETSEPREDQSEIPEVVDSAPLVSEPQPGQAPEQFSIVAQDVPVRELLFAMARDADLNVDIHPDISGQVYLNAIDQTLPQILERIARQVDLRWRMDEHDNLVVQPDTAYWHTYRVDYVNVERNASTSADISTSLANINQSGGGGGGAGNNQQQNNSTSTLSQNSSNTFWPTLRTNLAALLGEGSGDSAATSSIVANPESGVINVHATGKEHAEISQFLNFVQTRSLHQVLIEATVVEVDLNDRYQSGVDWAAFAEANGASLNYLQEAAPLDDQSSTPTSLLTYENNDGDVTSTVRLLSRFGDLKVLSSPKLMALNNQSAMLRVVDNRVYFNVEVQQSFQSSVSGGIITPPTYTTEAHTVPVGFVMTVTPQIGDGDRVTLNVRPTISRILRFVNDPNPILAENDIANQVPEIQIRELESVLKLYSGEIAILGGLMQDSLEQSTSGLPGLSRVPGLRNLFSNRDDAARKTELIVFIRPVIVREPSLARDLREYRDYLPADETGQTF